MSPVNYVTWLNAIQDVLKTLEDTSISTKLLYFTTQKLYRIWDFPKDLSLIFDRSVGCVTNYEDIDNRAVHSLSRNECFRTKIVSNEPIFVAVDFRKRVFSHEFRYRHRTLTVMVVACSFLVGINLWISKISTTNVKPSSNIEREQEKKNKSIFGPAVSIRVKQIYWH